MEGWEELLGPLDLDCPEYAEIWVSDVLSGFSGVEFDIDGLTIRELLFAFIGYSRYDQLQYFMEIVEGNISAALWLRAKLLNIKVRPSPSSWL